MGYPSFQNLRFEAKAHDNLYESLAWKECISKTRSGLSYRTYLANGTIMLNTTCCKETFLVQGTWLNVQGTSMDNNIAFKPGQTFELLSIILNLTPPASSQNVERVLTGGNIRLNVEGQEGRIVLTRGVRSITIPMSSAEEFSKLQRDCVRALEVLLLLQSRYAQRRRLSSFLVHRPPPCSCPSGGSEHVRFYYYSGLVSTFEDVLPLEWISNSKNY